MTADQRTAQVIQIIEELESSIDHYKTFVNPKVSTQLFSERKLQMAYDRLNQLTQGVN